MKHYILVLISALLFSGCSCLWESESDCPMPAAGRAENITLSFRMISSNIGHTRADGLHEERDSEWPQFEDVINVRDFAFYIFLDNDAEGRKPLVMKMTDISASHNPNAMVTGSYGAYTVTSVIPRESMEKLLGRALSASSSEPVVFRIVILANSGAGVDYNALATDPAEVGTNVQNVTTYEEFMNRAEALLFNLNDIHNPVTGDSGVDGLYKGAIPMFGMGTFTTNEELLYASRTEERIWLGEVFMLRALAKLRVEDNAPTDADGYPYVTAVSVRSTTNRGYQLPDGALYYTNGSQVHDIRVPEKQAYANTEFRLGYRTKSGDKAKLPRFGYLPEQEIGEDGPVIRVTAQLNADMEKTYEIPMTGYNGTPFDFEGRIMRNHIYTLSIEKITVGTPAEITVRVDDWKESTTTLHYTEVVTVSERVQWTPGSYDNNLNPGEGRVKMLPWNASGKSVPLECTFKLATPSGAKWTAYLLPKEGNTDAFAFIDGEGNAVGTAVSGTVKNTETTLRIVSTKGDPDVLSSALLQIVVTLGNGTNIEADVTPEGESFRNYTIVQDIL